MFLVGVTPEDAAALRLRLARADVFDVVGEGVLANVQSGVTVVPSGIDAVLMSPRGVHRPPPPPVDDDELLLESLTPRERTVLGLVADGMANRDIARALDISEHTVKFHLASVFGKLGASSRTEAVRRGLRLGLIEI